jgi:L-lactate dehydrogenase
LLHRRIEAHALRAHLGRHFGVAPSSVNAEVIGEHGTASVFLWSSAPIADNSVEALVDQSTETKRRIEEAVRHANITIIEGIGVSQYGTGIVSAPRRGGSQGREGYSSGVKPSSGIWGEPFSAIGIGAAGVERLLMPQMSGEEEAALHASPQHIANTSGRLRQWSIGDQNRSTYAPGSARAKPRH